MAHSADIEASHHPLHPEQSKDLAQKVSVHNIVVNDISNDNNYFIMGDVCL